MSSKSGARPESLVLVNTGDGKGKSSAAFGVMGRAWARGWRIEVVQGIQGRAPHTNVIITGRDAPQELIDVADTVSEVRMVKHAFEQGIKARRGIEY